MPSKGKAAKRSVGRPSFRNTDRHDLDLLAIIDHIGGNAGATAQEIAMALGISTNGDEHVTPARIIGPRLGAMRTVGVVDRRSEKGEDDAGPFMVNVWFLTDAGKGILKGKLSGATEKALSHLDAGARLRVVQRIAQDGYIEGDRVQAHVIKRQLNHSLAQRKLSWR